MMLTFTASDAMKGVQQQNLLSGLKPCLSRRPTRHKSVFFHGIISYDPGVWARNGGRFLDTVVSTCMSRIAKIETLVSGLTQIKEDDMTNLSIDPVKDAIFDLEIIEYDLKRAVQLLVNISCEERGLPEEIHYLIDRVYDHTEEISTIYNRLIVGWREKKNAQA